MSSLKQDLTYLGVALVAGGLGLLAGLLVAPASGRETRRKIGRRLDEEKDVLVRKGQRALEDVADYVEDHIDEGKRKLNKVVRR
jgi:gas vesicle protein